MRDVLVDSAGITIAARDFGGPEQETPPVALTTSLPSTTNADRPPAAGADGSGRSAARRPVPPVALTTSLSSTTNADRPPAAGADGSGRSAARRPVPPVALTTSLPFTAGAEGATRESADGSGRSAARGSVLLLHGSGGNLATVTPLAEALRAHHRVVAVDLRGHGRSGDGPWDWEAVLADLAAVADAFGLAAPAVVGVSLGGMLAAQWARHHPECPGAVSLDGNPTPTRPEQLPGLDPAEAARELARLDATFTAMAAAMAEPLSAEHLATARTGQRAMAARYGIAEETWDEAFERNLTVHGDGTFLRPRADTLARLRRFQQDFDPVQAARDARCALLLVMATEDLPEQRAFHRLYAAHRAGLADRLDAAGRDNPLLRVTRLEGASHAMAVEHPARLADLITDFLAQAPTEPSVAARKAPGPGA
ncbi:alpha/beta fold hydrolase [Marinactinospora rubrisoli]|uniref:Alpha/beta fold hydrolase n=1 Tax=Marinactinospora rubrisoli TaxID=2715399 RepID=A0ABW2KFF3_9ACTN